MKKPHRNTIFVENSEILEHQAFPGNQFSLRVNSPQIASKAKPGQFAHISCHKLLPLRRPLSIMRTNKHAGWVEFLYKVVGQGTQLLSQQAVGEKISIMGPIGNCFEHHMDKPKALLIGGGVGIPPMVFLADKLREIKGAYDPFVIMGSEVPFPFNPIPSKYMVPGMQDGVIAAMPLMEDWDIPSRLASQQDIPGCHSGYVTEVADNWLQQLDQDQRNQVAIFSCGPHPMLESVAKLADKYHLPCHVSLEEFMACAVGGCAGCVVKVQTSTGEAMKRVCVDGPVFDSRSVF